jgi:hypothetical protein
LVRAEHGKGSEGENIPKAFSCGGEDGRSTSDEVNEKKKRRTKETSLPHLVCHSFCSAIRRKRV